MPNWKKVIISGSDASLNNVVVNDLTVEGNFFGNGENDGDWFIQETFLTASKDVQITGSLIVTGSITANGEASFLENKVTVTNHSNTELFVDGLITASSHISASGNLFASLSSNSSNFRTVMYNTASGQFFFTGSYGGGGSGVQQFDTISINNNGVQAGGISVGSSNNDIQFVAGPGITMDISSSISEDLGDFTAFIIVSASDTNITASGGDPGGDNHHVQYNNNGSFGGRKDFKFYDDVDDGVVRVGTQLPAAAGSQTNAEANLYSGSHVMKGANPLMTTANIPSFNSTVVFTGFGHKFQTTTDDGELYATPGVASILTPSLQLDDYGTPTAGISAFSDMVGNNIAGTNMLTHVYAVIKQSGTALYAHQFTTIPGSPSITIDGNGLTIIPSASTEFDVTGSSTQGTGSLITPIASASGRITITEASNPANSTFDIIGRKSTFYKTGESGSEENYMIYDNSSDIIALGAKGLTTSDIASNKDSATKVLINDPLTANSAVHLKQDFQFTPSEFTTATGNNNTIFFGGNVGTRIGTLATYPNNKQRFTRKIKYHLDGGGSLGGDISKPFFDLENSDLSLTKSGSSGDVKGGILFTSNPNIFFFNETDASASISGSLMPDSASAQIKFDTGSSALKFFAGSTTETLKEVLHISKSGDNPRIGIGTDNPIKAFDFKEVRDDDRGGELLIRGSRTTRGADVNDEVGRINFAIDSASFNKIDTSGSAAEIVAIVDEVDQTGIKGHMSFRIANSKTGEPTQILKLSQSTSVLGSPLDLNGALSVDLNDINASTINRYNNTSTRIELAQNHLEFYGNAYGLKISNTGIDANPGGLASMDFKVRSENDEKAIFVDSGLDSITLGSSANTHITASGNLTVGGSITATGDIIASRYVVSSSVTHLTQSFSSGSTIFGDSADDTHQFVGAITASGNISASGQLLAEAGPTINITLTSNSATNIDTFNTSSNNGAIYDYTLFSAPSGARAGQCMVIHHNGSTDFTDTSTNTLGSETSIPFFETAVNGSNVEVKIASGSDYTFKAFVKKL